MSGEDTDPTGGKPVQNSKFFRSGQTIPTHGLKPWAVVQARNTNMRSAFGNTDASITLLDVLSAIIQTVPAKCTG